MFAASVTLLISLVSLTSSVFAKPLSYRRDEALALRNAPALDLQARDDGNVSFSNFDNISSLQGFDDFNDKTPQTIVIKETKTQCEDVKIQIVQQRLAILREVAKKIITEHICNVETQTIVLAQHNGALQVFRDDIQRKTVTRQIGFDEQIASKFNEIFQEDGMSLLYPTQGFTGQDVGKNVVVPRLETTGTMRLLPVANHPLTLRSMQPSIPTRLYRNYLWTLYS
ncbi:hypothetical protein C8F01DRAFT_1247351 [Mycena amicta]|nr:hypothetical protein C8F01DRAFT_1247351 [Mycena amicta]